MTRAANAETTGHLTSEAAKGPRAGSDKVIQIGKRIIGHSVRKATEIEAPPVVIETNPLRMLVESREEGTWPAITTKMKIPTATGVKTVYFSIGFGVVCGRMGGKQVCVERPLEFFIPANQINAEEYISATMRSLSLNARAGLTARALKELRQVVGRDPVWYGKTASGKTLVHDSAVAAIAWEMQQQLMKRGFLDAGGNECPLQDLVEKFQRMRAHLEAIPDGQRHVMDAPPTATGMGGRTKDGLIIVGTCPDKDCRGDMVLKDNCPTCVDCGYSKCG